jgi:hypothetical protein
MVNESDRTVVSMAELKDVLTESVDDAVASGTRSAVERRARGDAPYDHVVVLDDWAYESWSDYDIAESPILLVGAIEDYSEKSFFAEGAFEINGNAVSGRPADEIDGVTLTNLVRQVDETQEDFIDDVGATYLPKSAVEDIIVVGVGD